MYAVYTVYIDQVRFLIVYTVYTVQVLIVSIRFLTWYV